jgi:tetratricopeptide (TPR) repeat protein
MDSILAETPLDSLAPGDRPYLTLARLYARAGDPDRAERLYQAWERETPEILRAGNIDRPGTEAMIALARNRPAEAVPLFRKAREVEGCQTCWLYEMGEAFDEMGQPDSARAAYEGLASLPEPGPSGRQFTLAAGLRRLAELSEAKGDKAKAADFYTRFIGLWRDADPELQPRVTKAKQRLAELVGEPKP